MANSNSLTGLARCLVREGLLSETQVRQWLDQAQQTKSAFIVFLINNKLLSPYDIAAAASRSLGLVLLDLDGVDLTVAPVSLLGEKLLRRYSVLPLYKRGKRIFVAVSDPTDTQVLDEIQFHLSASIEIILVEHDKLLRAINQVVNSINNSLVTDLVNLDLENPVNFISGHEEINETTTSDLDDTPVVRFINKVLSEAIHKKASDIHFEPYEKNYRVRFRQDGILHEITSPPITLAGRLAARIKVMARLDISERRIPQDGRIKMALPHDCNIDLRVNTCPTLWGEKVVLRILDSTQTQLSIDELGYELKQKQLVIDAIQRPQGIILVTGPTGSGKTVSLYSAISLLNTSDRNICTAEDPVEINLPGINQVHINPKVGLTFATALRAFLRQDPDIILVGEIRDLETAEIAIKAAQTGHLVLSTLHTNDAPQTLQRLVSMGVPAYNIASTVNLIVAQRLARRLCKHCKQPLIISPEILIKEGFQEQELSNLIIYGPRGCDQCASGYRGRVGIYQVMPISETMGAIIMEGGNSLQLGQQAQREGVINLRQSGLNKVRMGITSLAEINRVTII